MTPVIRYSLADLEEQENYCLCDGQSLNNTISQEATFSSPPAPQLSSPPNPDCLFHRLSTTVFQFVCVYDPKLCLQVRSVCICMCAFMLLLQMHTEKTRPDLWLYLPAVFAGLWSWIWGMRHDLPSDSSLFPRPSSFLLLTLDHKMQLVCELIPPPARLYVNLLSLLSHVLDPSFSFPFSYQSSSSLKEHVFLPLLLTSCQQTWRIKFHTLCRWISQRWTEVMMCSGLQIINATILELYI